MSITYTSISSLLASPFQRLTSSMWNTASLLLIQLYETGGNAVTSILKNGNLTIPGSITASSGFFYDEVYVAGQPVLTELDPIYIAGFIATANQQINAILYSNEQLYYSIVKLPEEIYEKIIIAVPTVTSTLSKDTIALYETIYNVVNYLISNVQQTRAIISQDLQNFYVSFYELVSSIAKRLGLSLQNAIYFIADSIAYTLTYVYLATVGLANTINKLSLYLSPPTIEGLQLDVSTVPSPLYSGPPIETVRIILQNLSNYIVYIGNQLYNNFPILQNDSLEIHVNNPANVYAWATGKAKVYALFEVI
ncbi:hypothetical protein CCL42_gp47 [Sulfolobus islandicus rod-shaped virus 8]|uniref:Uncharacterized protein n=1 Tax=Sulfolobus islandicus rod-shaped virus 8 TaxID=1983551 RepID=A0A1X9SJM9_9VIRU|nr:hypothetical protein CCL42_gp47 [Sulfolobus islandicus rod-shaped virus 8]ARQ96453.1 hypothetical protein [Sulfolobus islandicus rod-shaped virus 8]